MNILAVFDFFGLKNVFLTIIVLLHNNVTTVIEMKLYNRLEELFSRTLGRNEFFVFNKLRKL